MIPKASWCLVGTEVMDPYIIPIIVPITHSLLPYQAPGSLDPSKSVDSEAPVPGKRAQDQTGPRSKLQEDFKFEGLMAQHTVWA